MSGDGNASVRGVEFGPAPATLELRDIPKVDVFPEGGGGVHVLLTEAVSDLTGPVPHHASRLVRQVTGRDGLQHVARFDTVFDPRFERVVIHHIRVIRDGVARDVARPDAFELMRREPNLERAIYDGRMTAHMIIPDVREGDIVDSCFSLIGEPPGLQNTFGWSFSLEWSVPVQETICRILAPADRKLRIRPWDGAADPEIIERDSVREYVWSKRDSVARTPDAVSPVWSPGYAMVEVADDLSWPQVSAMFVDLYEEAIGTAVPEGLEAEVEALVAAYPEPDAQAVEALRLVQRTLRYHSVAIGEGGYRPRPLATIWESRYGDCKDASVLLTAVLRRLGLKAVCALVNPTRGPTVAGSVLGPRVFNHCIVRVEVQGAVYWLDPTMPPQTGSLTGITQAHDYWALPLAAGGDLEEIAEPPMLVVREIEEVWTFPRNIKLASRLECRTTTRAWQADQARAVFEGQGEKTVADKYREALSRELRSSLRDVEPLRREDDVVTNTHTVVETYEVEKGMEPIGSSSARFQSADDTVSANLPLIPAGERRQPIAFGARRIVKISRTFKFAVATNFSPWNQLETGPGGLEGRNSFHWINDREGRHEIIVTIPVSFLPKGQAAAYRDFAERMHRNNGVGFSIETSGDSQSSSSGGHAWWMVLGAIFLVTAVVRCMGAAG